VARIVKDADVRRDELLDAALALFLEHGYERTSVEQITQAVGVAKGTFYHYFETKDALLEQLVDRYSIRLFEEVEAAIAHTDGDAISRLRVLMSSSTTAKLTRADETLLITESLYSPTNRTMLDRMRDGWMERLRPIIAQIIEQGCAEGSFDVPDIEGYTDICLSLWLDYGVRVGARFFAARGEANKMREVYSAVGVLMSAIERILGAKPGSLGIDPTAVYEVLSGLQ
jgi:AcrR family transcriptional regulator